MVIKDVISDTELTIADPIIGHTLENSEYWRIPKMNTAKIYDSVWRQLGKGQSLAIFPEGGSHDRTDLLPLKAGVTIMALGALAKHPNLKISIVAVGLKYFNPHKFRSKLIVEFSRPYRIPQELVDNYQVKEKKREACSTLLKEIEKKMREVTLTAPSYEILRNIYLARDVYMPSNVEKLSDTEINEGYKRFFKGFNILKDQPEAKEFLEDIDLYRKELRAFNLRDQDVLNLKMNFCIIIYNFFYSVFAILFYMAFALIGLAILEPMGLYNSITGEVARKEALAGSVVKVVGADVVASHKMVNTFKIFPLICMFITGIYYFYFSPYLGGDSIMHRMFHSTIFFIFCPLYAYMCILARDRVKHHFYILKARFYVFFYTEHVLTIQGMRNNLKKKVRHLVNVKGPEIFNDFEEIKQRQLERLYKENRSATSRQNEALEIEVEEALEEL